MLFLTKRKDGGPDSKVVGYWLVEIKGLFSICLLHFLPGSRDAYHNHAFNAISWLFKGQLLEEFSNGLGHPYNPSIKPIYTSRECFHKVTSVGHSWALSFRGPWKSTWNEYLPQEGKTITLGIGREEL